MAKQIPKIITKQRALPTNRAFDAPMYCAVMPASSAPKPFVVCAKTVIKLAALPSMPSGAKS